MSGKTARVLIVVPCTALLAYLFISYIAHQNGQSETAAPSLEFPPEIKRLDINIGPNYSPIQPRGRDGAVLAVEPNIGIANHLREHLQKDRWSKRFFVLNCAVSSKPLAGGIAMFRQYNYNGLSSSLSKSVRDGGDVPFWANEERHNLSDPSSPGTAGIDFVPVISLQVLLSSIPKSINIELLKTDTQGHDLSVIRSASVRTLRRVRNILSETYIGNAGKSAYQDVANDLKDWLPYMRKAGYKLLETPPKGTYEWDAKWERVG